MWEVGKNIINISGEPKRRNIQRPISPTIGLPSVHFGAFPPKVLYRPKNWARALTNDTPIIYQVIKYHSLSPERKKERKKETVQLFVIPD